MSDKSHKGSQPEEDPESGEPEWEVLRVLDERITKEGKHEFYVKWKDQGGVKYSKDKWDEWLREDQMACPELIEQFREKRNAKLDRSRKDRSTSRALKETKKKDKHRKSTKARGGSRERDEDEDSDVPRRVATPKRKKIVIESDDDEDDAPRSSRSRSTVDKDDQPTSTTRSRGRKKKTELEKLRLTPPPPPSSSRKEPQEAARSSPIPEWMNPVKRESVSPDKQKELRSAVTSNLPKRSAAESKRWRKIQEREKNKKHMKTTLNKRQPEGMPSTDYAEIGGVAGPQLFKALPDKAVKSEMHPDEDVADEMDRMDVFDDLREPRERASSSMEQDEAMEGGEEGEGEGEAKEDEGREQEGEAEAEVEEEESGERENPPSDESIKVGKKVGDSEGGRMEEEGKERETHSHEAKDVKKEEKNSMENGEEMAGTSEEKSVQANGEFSFHPTNAPTGYDQNFKGTIVDIKVIEFTNGKKRPFCHVYFKDLHAIQEIEASIVEERDPMGFRSFLRDRYEEREQKRIKKGAAAYRAGRDKRLREEAERAAAAAGENESGSSLV